MTHLPSGTVTFLFTDIEGSTKLAQQYPEAAPGLMARHNEILDQSILSHDGYIFQRVGDSFCAAFHSAGEALNAALVAQKCLFQESWTPAPVKVRMGIHTGDAQAGTNGQYTGYTTLALTQRIMSAGHGGQVLLSGATRELVRDSLPEPAALMDLGERRLKDLLRPERLYQVNVAGLPTTFPPLKTLDAFPNNLPVQLTTFIGREKEIDEIKWGLTAHRLVTLTGSGGTGKTRLSLQVAADMIEKFNHGIWFVELAPLTDPELIAHTILSTIGIVEQRGKKPFDVLKEYLQERQILILLDNCEHLIDACARLVNELLSAAPRLKILASSREALGVSGEVSYPVPSLELPDIKHLPLIEQLSQYEAVRLFIDRALLVAPHFAVDKENAPSIAQICYRLDGIPLAIELAAARVKVLSVEQISLRLNDRFRLLTGGSRTALPRQQTLRALIDWSYDLLTEDERLLLRRLSVFAGGWTLEAAEEVCTGEGLEVYDVLELLTQLVNKSLVVLVDHTQSGETRYRMLETIRQYAQEKLLKAGGSENIHDTHLAYFVKLAKQAEPELYRSNQVFWLNRLEDELDNLRLALDWSLEKSVKSGLELITVPVFFWEIRTNIQEWERRLAKFLERYKEADSLRTHALIIYAHILGMTNGLKKAESLANQSLALSRTISDRYMEAYSLWGLGSILTLQGNLEEGIPHVEQSLAIYRSIGDPLGQSIAARWLSLKTNDPEHSRSLLLESLKLSRELGNISGIAVCLNLLADKAIRMRDFSSAAAWLEESKRLHHQLGDQTSEAGVFENYGKIFYWQGDYSQSCACYEEAIKLYEKVGILPSWVQAHLAYTELRLGNSIKARELLKGCIRQFRKANMETGLIFVIEGLASLDTRQGRLERAACLFSCADAHRSRGGDLRPPVEQGSVERDLDTIHSQLDETVFDQAWEQGAVMTLDQALAVALDGSYE
jgi:predicted ATPase/class 3 adenylate cyclase